jgi:ABC-type antimicrobial peptide transport system permease subunit
MADLPLVLSFSDDNSNSDDNDGPILELSNILSQDHSELVIHTSDEDTGETESLVRHTHANTAPAPAIFVDGRRQVYHDVVDDDYDNDVKRSTKKSLRQKWSAMFSSARSRRAGYSSIPIQKHSSASASASDSDSDSDSYSATRFVQGDQNPSRLRNLSDRVAAHNSKASQSSLAQWYAAVLFVISDVNRSSRSFMIGVFTVLLVTCFTAIVLNEVAYGPVVFMRLNEQAIGEMDLIVTPGYAIHGQSVEPDWPRKHLMQHAGALDTQRLMNFSLYEERTASSGFVDGSTPRWIMLTALWNPTHTSNVTTIALTIDSLRESQIGLGRAWEMAPLGPDECYVSAASIRQLGMSEQADIGSHMILEVSPMQLLLASGIGDDSVLESATNFDSLIGMLLPNSSRILNMPLGPIASRRPWNATIIERQLLNVMKILQPDADMHDIAPAIKQSLEKIEQASHNISASNSSVTLGDVLEPVLMVTFEAFKIRRQLEYRGSVEDPNGKWPTSLGTVVMLEESTFENIIQVQVERLKRLHGNSSKIIDAAVGLFETLSQSQVPPQLVRNFKQFASQPLPPQVNSFDSWFRLSDYAFSIISMYKDRIAAYTASAEALDAHFIAFSNDIAERIGVQTGTFSAPLYKAVSVTMILRDILDSVFGVIIVMLAMLGAMLVYSLMMDDTDTKTYEYSMLRALGMKKQNLMRIVLIKSFAFALCGTVIGIAVASLVNIPLAQLVSQFADTVPELWLSSSAVGTSVTLAFVMTAVGAIGPVQRALSKNLRDSLDMFHTVASDYIVTTQRLADLGLDVWQSVVAVMLVVCGFVVFLVIPWSFMLQNMQLFLGILNATLIGMLLGLCILSILFHSPLQRCLLRVFTWRVRHLYPICSKNIIAHKRNRMTSILYTFAIAFVVFCNQSLHLNMNSFTSNVRLFVGTDLSVVTPNRHFPLDEQALTDFLNGQVAGQNAKGIVAGFSFVSFQMSKTPHVRWNKAGSLPQQHHAMVYAVQPNYIDAVFSDYVHVVERDTSLPSRDVVRLLFNRSHTFHGERSLPKSIASGVYVADMNANGGTLRPSEGSQLTDHSARDAKVRKSYTSVIDVLCSESYRGMYEMSLSTPMRLNYRGCADRDDVSTCHWYSRLAFSSAFIAKMPGFFFSSYSVTALVQPLLISETQYANVIQSVIGSEVAASMSAQELVPKQRVMIKMIPGTTRKQREDLINEMKPMFTTDQTVALDTQALLDGTQDAMSLMQLLFAVVTIVALSICFFVLLLSNTRNVRENAWEHGVLRSLGINRTHAIMIYVFESLALCITALIMGVIIGCTLAATLQLQSSLFTEMPFDFSFEWTSIALLFVLTVVTATAASVTPAYGLSKKRISAVLRHT